MIAPNHLPTRRIPYYCVGILLLWYYFISIAGAPAQVVLKGRLLAPQHPDSNVRVPITAVYCFANQTGPGNQALGFRTWETHPAGWYYLSGNAGNYTMVFSNPAGFMRPLVRANQFVMHGDIVDRTYAPDLDYADFTQTAWDDMPGDQALPRSASGSLPTVWMAPVRRDRTSSFPSTEKPSVLPTPGPRLAPPLLF